ncbi:hypothetical protein ACFFRR_007129 [Megaselia abdita]
MKDSLPLSFVLVCAIVLFVVAQDTEAKKGCQFYGHSCYGGHGKRSLTNENEVMNQNNVIQPRLPTKIADNQIYQNQMFAENEQEERILEKFPRYRLIKMIKDIVSKRRTKYFI